MLVKGYRQVPKESMSTIYTQPSYVTVVDGEGPVGFADDIDFYQRRLSFTDVTSEDKTNLFVYHEANPLETIYLIIEPGTNRRQYCLTNVAP